MIGTNYQSVRNVENNFILLPDNNDKFIRIIKMLLKLVKFYFMMITKLFCTKSISTLLADTSDENNSLKRTLSRWNLTSLGIGAIIGAGIFVLTGQASTRYAGPAVVISFIVAAIACGFAGLCYAEFASVIPIS